LEGQDDAEIGHVYVVSARLVSPPVLITLTKWLPNNPFLLTKCRIL